MSCEEEVMAPFSNKRRPADANCVSLAEQPSIPTRREFCTKAISSAGLLLASGYLPPAFAQSDAQSDAWGDSAALNLDKDSDLLRAHIKMRYSTGPEFSMGWMRGKRFAYSEGRVEPLCGMLAAVFAKRNQVSTTVSGLSDILSIP